MKLLYLYIEDYGCIKNQEFNFDSEMQFHYDSKNTHELSIVKQDLLPKNFWGNGSVKSISAIVGNNGAGKTTIARFIVDFLYYTYTLKDCHFIVVFKKKNEPINCVYNLDKKELKMTEFECKSLGDYEEKMPKGVPVVLKDECSIDFAYHSNYFSPVNKWNNELDDAFDISTTAYLYEDSNIIPAKRTHNYQNSTRSSLKISIDEHKSKEYKRNLIFLQKIYSLGNDISNKIKELIPDQIIIEDASMKYFKNNAIKIRNNIKKINIDHKIVDDNLLDEYLEKIERLVDIKHHENERFVDFRIKTYIKITLIDAFLDRFSYNKTNKIKILLDFVKDIDTTYDLELLNSVIDFLNNNINIFENPKIHYFIQEINNLNNEKELYYQDIKVNKNGNILIKCDSHLLELLNVFETESSLFYLDDYFNFDFKPTLSSGEMSCLTIFSRLNDYFFNERNKRKYDDFIIFFDEIEITLEPKLQRRVVSLIIDYLNLSIFEGCSFHTIFASHSPILLSDIPDTNVVFLKKVSGQTQVVDHETAGKTFGSNIYTLYKKSFFMDEGLMGEFAEQKIENIINELIDLESKKYTDKNKRENKYQELGKEIDLIGEPVICNQLKDRLNWVKIRIK